MKSVEQFETPRRGIGAEKTYVHSVFSGGGIEYVQVLPKKQTMDSEIFVNDIKNHRNYKLSKKEILMKTKFTSISTTVEYIQCALGSWIRRLEYITKHDGMYYNKDKW
ncbi:MAG: hypothetical protein EZS28_029477 [Streblomastix strix]|uniref:Uncharacterized protein n=1 Tax=Streblomastix strix TaxID=222440 RepID=A0A5J4UWA8_9EUKA|nr:MAG: hypothetical protein EZS28_029477 [Streblomastix strix]